MRRRGRAAYDALQEIMSAASEVLIADAESDWRAALATALQAEGIRVRLTADGAALEKALAQPPATGVVLIGQGLTAPAGLEVLHRAATAKAGRPRAKKGEPPGLAIFLLAESRTDAELLELLRRRGATHFFYREDPLEQLLGQLTQWVYRDRRAADRRQIKVPGRLALGSSQLPCTTEDLSRGGSLVCVPARRLAEPPGIGARVAVELESPEGAFRIQAEVRRVLPRPGFFGDKLVLGLQFLDVDEATHQRILHLLESDERQRRSTYEALSQGSRLF